jgi:tetratricopeptide (TPR) repeat protein
MHSVNFLKMLRFRRAALIASFLAAVAGASAQHARHASPKPKPKPPAASDEAAPAVPRPTIEAIRNNNVGVALMDLRDFRHAVANFQSACIMLPNSDAGCLNAGIAMLAMRQYGDARRIFTSAAQQEPQNPRAWFNLGLLERADSRPRPALEDFQKAAALDAEDSAAQSWIGRCYEDLQDYTHALAAFQTALKLDPLSATAEAGIAEAGAKTGASDTATHLARSKRLIQQGLSKLSGGAYGASGKYSFAAEIPPPTIVAPAAPIHFVDVTSTSGLAARAATPIRGRGRAPRSARATAPARAGEDIQNLSDFLGSGACVFAFDGDRKPSIFLVDADGKGDAALYRNLGGGKFADVTKASKITFQGAGMACAVGDYDNDGLPDLAVSFNGGVRLFHNQGKGVFADVTDASGIRAGGLVLGLAFIDYDRDGDLDLFVSRSHDAPLEHPNQPFALPQDAPPGNMLWRSNGDGTFSDATAALGLAGDSSSTGAIASDLAGNGALDVVTTNWRRTPGVLLNPRDGAFRAATPWPADTPGPTAGAVALDYDKDGLMDFAFTEWAPPGVSLWHNVAGKSFVRDPIAGPGWMRAWGIAAIDYDRDGWIDLVAVGDTFSGEGRIALLRDEGTAGFRDVSLETGLDKIALQNPRSVVAFDAAGDGSLYLLITQNHRPPVLLKAVGNNPNGWAEFALRGDSENALGLGTPIEVFSGALRQRWEIPGASGYLSQGPASIFAGLGEGEHADAVRVLWSNGRIQGTIEVGGSRRITLSQSEIP